MKEKPLVSVVMPACNAAKTLPVAMESVLDQTYHELELIVINDGSTDETGVILEEFAARDSRVSLIHNEENLGISKSLNKGLNAARGKYIARMDGDDVCLPQRFGQQMDWLEANDNCVLVGSYVESFGDKQGVRKFPLEDGEIKAALMFEFPFEHPAVMMRKEVLDRENIRYDEGLGPSEDWDIFFKLSQHGAVKNLPEVLLKLRQHTHRTHRLQSDRMTRFNRMLFIKRLKVLGLYRDFGDDAAWYSFFEKVPPSNQQELRDWNSAAWHLVDANRTIKCIHEEAFSRYVMRRWEDVIRICSADIPGSGRMFFTCKLAALVKPRLIQRIKMAIRISKKR